MKHMKCYHWLCSIGSRVEQKRTMTKLPV